MNQLVHVQAHRGASKEALENTLESIEIAARMGVDSIEIDVQVLKDGTPILFHDFSIIEGFISNFTFEEVGKMKWDDPRLKISTLEQVLVCLSAFSNSKRPILDIELKYTEKNPKRLSKEDVVKRVLSVTLQKNLETHLTFRSFDWDILRIVKRESSKSNIIPLLSQKESEWDEALKLKTAWVAPPCSTVRREWIEKAHHQSTKVIVYTANTPDEWTRLMDLGVDGITTDYPRELIQFLKHLKDA